MGVLGSADAGAPASLPVPLAVGASVAAEWPGAAGAGDGAGAGVLRFRSRRLQVATRRRIPVIPDEELGTLRAALVVLLALAP